MTKPDAKPYLTAKDVASLLMVSPNTIRIWTCNGLLKSETTLGGHRRFLRSDIEKMLQERSHPPAKKRPSILIIEDEEALAQTMAEGLMEAVPGLSVHIATDGFSGGLKSSLLKPDVVLLDLMMPGMSGVEVCRMLKQEPQTQHIRVIAYTGYATQDQVDAVIAQGAESCLLKPLRIPKLLQAIGLNDQATSEVSP